MSSHLAARVPFSVFVNLKLVFIGRQMSDKVLVRQFSETAFYCCVEYVCGSFLHASHRAWSVRAGQWTHCCFVLFFSRPRSSWTYFLHLSLSSVILIDSLPQGHTVDPCKNGKRVKVPFRRQIRAGSRNLVGTDRVGGLQCTQQGL